jgi:anhydro-N-acetylmuramic acid kinase
MEPIWAVGLMSGTSLDGVDAAAVLTDGEAIAAFGPSHALMYTDDQRAVLRAALDWAEAHYPRNYKLTRRIDLWDIEAFRAAEAVLDETHGSALAALDGAAPAVVGFHGQTVLHRPEDGFTLQIGDAALLAGRGATVVHDFRSADMAAGGEGAPLVPFFHHACARWAGLGEPVAFLNIGGVANVTWLDPAIEDPAEACLAFDTGPGNALVNDWMAKAGGEPMDRGGAAAASGRVHRERLGSNAARAYLDRRPPKSLDRNDFAGVLAAMGGLSVPDGAATLTAFTVDCIAEAVRHMPAPPARWLICGGGRHNATMMAGLAARLPGVEPVEAIGLDGDMLEAQAFAWLAVRVLRGLPLSAPRTTGCGRPVIGGRIFRG